MTNSNELLAEKTKSQRFLVPEGTHIARIIRLIHIGTNLESFKGEPKEFNKIQLTWELPNETIVVKEGEDPKPMVTSQEYTLSFAEKANLRKITEGIIGTRLTDDEAWNFSPEKLVGLCSLITVIHKISKAGNTRAEILSTSPLMKGQECKESFNPYRILTYLKWDEDYFNSLPDFLKNKMKTTPQYKKMRDPNYKEGSSLSDSDKQYISELRSKEDESRKNNGGITSDDIPF